MLAAVCLTAGPAAAEEFYLKDGNKIVGKVVGYEKNSFRVETSFGIALIYKDRIARIVFAEAAAGPTSPSPPTAGSAPATKETGRKETPVPRTPEKIVERVTGTRYVNETYRFQMFKPPTWRSYPELVKPQSALVAALGTPDETTLLLIGRESYNGDLAAYARVAEGSLRQLYEDYKREGERRTTVAGLAAVERDFTGAAEGRFWTGTALYFARDQQYYTLLALTAAGETTNFQQALLRKVIDTLEFLPE